MENKTMYLYQISLADGRVVLHESEGMFNLNSEDKEDRTLINSVTLIKIMKPEVTEQEVEVEVMNEPVVDNLEATE